MKGIKTREPKKDIHSLDKAKSLAGKMKSGLIRSNDTVQNLSDDGQVSAEEYAQDNVKYMSEDVASDTAHASKAAAKKSYEGGKKLVQQIKQRQHTAEDIKQTAKSTGKQTFKTLNRNIKTAGQSTGKAVKTSERTSRAAIKTSQNAAKTAKLSAKAAKKSAVAAKRTAQTAKKAAEATVKTAKAAGKATVAAIKAIAASIKSLVTAIAAGGWVAVVIIIVIVLVALIAGSCFGIFFSSDDSNGGMTIRSAVSNINSEYQSRIDAIKNSVTHDKLIMEGRRAKWQEILAVYSVKTSTGGNDAQEVATMNDEKLEILRSVFWDMHEISSRTETDDTETTLIITISSKTAEEMKSVYRFSTEQKERLDELLSDENADLWRMVLYGIGSGSTDIVEVAIEQLGNVGGQPYWSWYGFPSRVEWCCCFVSWCANECGYIEQGIIPMCSVVDDGANWFKTRGQWLDGSEEPQAGMIIFFDWAYDGLGDGGDHTGIVEKVENGMVYTIEGNSGDACREKSYPIGYYEIMGYGFYEQHESAVSDDAAAQVWAYLKSYGYSDSVAAGIIGNMMRECGGDTLDLKWNIVGHYNGEEYYGLCQWCLSYTPSGFKGSSIKEQCDYLRQTIQSAFANYGGNYGGITYSEFLKSDTRTAAIAFERVYERCGDYANEDGRRASNAERAYKYFH